MLRLYDTLLSLPLFQGVCGGDISDIVAHTRLGFQRLPRKSVAVSEGQRVEGLLFLVDGEMTMTTTAAGGAYSVTEWLSGPQLIEPERLFGLTQHYQRRYETATLCHLLTVPKDSVAMLLERYMVFRLNYLNTLSTLSQRRGRTLLRPQPASLEAAVCRFLVDRCCVATGEKLFRITQQHIADELRVSRRDISAALRTLHESGVIVMGRERIVVHDFRKLAIMG